MQGGDRATVLLRRSPATDPAHIGALSLAGDNELRRCNSSAVTKLFSMSEVSKIHRIPLVGAFVAAHLLDCFQHPTACENRQPAE